MTTTPERELATRPRLHFVDDAEAVGLRFVFDNGRTPMCLLPETISGGVGLIDFDGDGWLDVYCVQGGSLTAPDAPAGVPAPLIRDPSQATASFATRAMGRFARSRGRPGSTASPGAGVTAWVSPWATTTTTGIPTSSSPACAVMTCSAIGAMGPSRM